MMMMMMALFTSYAIPISVLNNLSHSSVSILIFKKNPNCYSVSMNMLCRKSSHILVRTFRWQKLAKICPLQTLCWLTRSVVQCLLAIFFCCSAVPFVGQWVLICSRVCQRCAEWLRTGPLADLGLIQRHFHKIYLMICLRPSQDKN